ncbi:SDR family NAD(P)-dependent oxidoreductase [Nocardia goodfellowii]|uniref:NAD(P)-dependent dehydrogenase (Short-subunit alcohol dehydrogenase family) n=1 Tax=Nocardia goodfellowii TaxID=882446 RepID=A0ABS4QK77_9NOCA|nr:SDR family NAD(P)-dependent oxidoreductase [Nocardia goodfellowii]MBP2192106.1 NAD(P)-dependent dehydrogenase (short-subunit alcohol dehydrogenase family) [Nocardia goodfellowii]
MTTMVMTGGTSGFGAITAERLKGGNARVILGARRPESDVDTFPLDLAELASVRRFADAVREDLGDTPIDALVLNAGLIRPDADGRTVDGFETTFAVDHLAHYLLLRLLLPALAEDAIVTLTTSGTHDPATATSLVPPRHADAELLAHPDRDPDRESDARKAGQHAYTAAKLCAVLTVRAVRERHPNLTVLAYDPGQVFGTGLAEELALPLRIAWKVMGTPVGWPARRFSPTLNTRSAAGNTLADLVFRLETPPPGHTYAAVRRGKLAWIEPSVQARDDKLADILWRDSARLLGLPTGEDSAQ